MPASIQTICLPKNPYYSTLCLTDQLLTNVIDKAFDACGYSFDFITGVHTENRSHYYERIRNYIDRGIPVIVKSKLTGCFDSYGVICGYCNCIGAEQR